MEKTIIEKFGNRIRVRVCGILIEEGRMLLVKHRSLGKEGVLWAPPGGGVHFGESAEESLKREFEEETGLAIDVEEFLFTHEFLSPPLHAVELFFRVNRVGGQLARGFDPEMEQDSQIIEQVTFLSWDQLAEIHPDALHYVLRIADDFNDLFNLHGYIKFEDFN